MFEPDLLNVLTSLASPLAGESRLTPAERSELLRIAQGMGCKDAANAASVSPETIRARRKRIYRKVGADGASEIISRLLATALVTLAVPAAGRVAHPEQGQAGASA